MLDQWGLDRIKHVLDGKCQSVVIENHYIDKDYRDTFSSFHSKRFATPSSRCVRLHFFSKAVTEEEIVNAGDAVKKSYLGYSVVRPTKPNCIGRTLLTSQLRLHPEAHIRNCTENIVLLGTEFEVEGFPFISQDSDATVCAESALWMIMRYYSNTYRAYPEILPFQITNLAAHHAGGHRVFPSSGLYSWQLAEALRLQKFSPVIYSRKQFGTPFDHLLYTYIESGIPLLITVPSHVVAAFGHQSNYAAPCPKFNAGFTYTSHFNQSFVINDDNCFPYQMLNKAGKQGRLDSEYPFSKIEEFIVPLPEKVFLTAEQAQTVIETILRDPKTGIQALSPSLTSLSGNGGGLIKKLISPVVGNGNKLLLRLFLTSSRSFKRSIQERGMGHIEVANLYRHLPMPHFIWVCEIANYDEYASEQKILGEVIWDATRNGREPDGWIALHFPEKLVYDAGSAFNNPQSPDSIKTIDLSGQNSYLLYKSNLHTL